MATLDLFLWSSSSCQSHQGSHSQILKLLSWFYFCKGALLELGVWNTFSTLRVDFRLGIDAGLLMKFLLTRLPYPFFNCSSISIYTILKLACSFLTRGIPLLCPQGRSLEVYQVFYCKNEIRYKFVHITLDLGVWKSWRKRKAWRFEWGGETEKSKSDNWKEWSQA